MFAAFGGHVRDVTPSALSSAPQEPVAEKSAGYFKSPVVLSTMPGLLATNRAAASAAVSPETEPDPKPQATPEPTPEPAPEPQPAYFTYTVQPGDTIGSIAASFGINADYILWNNPEVSDDPDLLVVGEDLLIPSVNGIVYHVRLGDTLSDIAAYYEIDTQSIQAFGANGISSPDSVIEGMVLLLPGGVPPPPPLPAAVAAVDATAPPPPPEPAPQPAPPSSTGYIWPWVGPITSYFDEWRGAGIHGAIDIDGFGNYGAAVVAAASGQVVLATWDDWGLGYHVVIRHDDGSETVYAHLSEIWVSQGQFVAQGEAVGGIGCTGYCTGPHLHFEILIGGVPVDPLQYLP